MSDDTRKDGPPTWLRHTSIGFEFFATIVGFALVGLWIDRRWETAPWGVLTGSLLGLVIGFSKFLRTAFGMLGPKKSKRPSQSESSRNQPRAQDQKLRRRK